MTTGDEFTFLKNSRRKTVRPRSTPGVGRPEGIVFDQKELRFSVRGPDQERVPVSERDTEFEHDPRNFDSHGDGPIRIFVPKQDRNVRSKYASFSHVNTEYARAPIRTSHSRAVFKLRRRHEVRGRVHRRSCQLFRVIMVDLNCFRGNLNNSSY